MSRPAMKTRTLRVDDKTWADALKTAERRGETLSEEIRKLLIKYAARK